MGLRAKQIKDLMVLYEDGRTQSEIALELQVNVTEIAPFIPTGKLALAYEGRIKASRDEYKAATLLAIAGDNVLASAAAGVSCATAKQSQDAAIKDASAQLKELRSTLKEINAKIEQISKDTSVAELGKAEKAHTKMALALEKAQAKLAAAKAADAKARKKEADRLERLAKADALATQAIVAAAAVAVKEIVDRAKEDRLNKE